MFGCEISQANDLIGAANVKGSDSERKKDRGDVGVCVRGNEPVDDGGRCRDGATLGHRRSLSLLLL